MSTQPAPLETEERPAAVCIGYPIWWFDVNRRKYQPLLPGQIYPSGGPIWKEHWRLSRVTGDSTRMWIVNHGAQKFSKLIKPGQPLPNGLAWTEDEVATLAWRNDHRGPIARKVEALDMDTLVRIARLIGYTPLP